MENIRLKHTVAGVIHHPVHYLEDAQIRHSVGRQADPLLGRLPYRRLIPTDYHSVLDYAASATHFAAAATCVTFTARLTGVGLGFAGLSVSLLTDYRLSLAKVIPIEVHEGIDYLWAGASIAAPFLGGYWKKEPIAAALQIFTGALTLLGSLFTDYRGYRGVKWFKPAATY